MELKKKTWLYYYYYYFCIMSWHGYIHCDCMAMPYFSLEFWRKILRSSGITFVMFFTLIANFFFILSTLLCFLWVLQLSISSNLVHVIFNYPYLVRFSFRRFSIWSSNFNNSSSFVRFGQFSLLFINNCPTTSLSYKNWYLTELVVTHQTNFQISTLMVWLSVKISLIKYPKLEYLFI